MKKQIVKYASVSTIGTLITYFGGVFFVDILGWQYWVSGLIVLPITFIIGFTLNKYWVFK